MQKSEQEKLAQRAAIKHYEAGRIISQKGQSEGFLLVIIHGSIRISLCSAAGKEFVLGIAGDGEIIGEASLIDGEPQEVDYIAQEKTKVLRIEHNYIAHIADQGDFDKRLNSILCRRLRLIITAIEDVTLYSLEARLARLLCRLHHHTEIAPSIQLYRFHQGLIAMMANASRSKVNQQLQHFLKMGAIEMNAGALSILNPDILEQISLSLD
jgi:CRP-like cAMP-binding protein